MAYAAWHFFGGVRKGLGFRRSMLFDLQIAPKLLLQANLEFVDRFRRICFKWERMRDSNYLLNVVFQVYSLGIVEVAFQDFFRVFV